MAKKKAEAATLEKPEAPQELEQEVPKVEAKQELAPLEPGQAYFESPEGFVMVGDADKPHIWCRAANGGKGMYINPKR